MKGFPSYSISFKWLLTDYYDAFWVFPEKQVNFRGSTSNAHFLEELSSLQTLKESLPLLDCNFASLEAYIRLHSNQRSLCLPREWKSIRIYSDMVGYICSLSISCKHSIWSLYATEHINILYLSTNKSRYYRIPLGYLGWPLNNVNE